MALNIAAIDRVGGSPPTTSPTMAAYAMAILGWLLSAGVYIAARWTAGEMPPWTICFWRLAIAGTILLPIVHHDFPVMRALLLARPLQLLLTGLLGLTLCQGLIYVGLEYTNATTAGIIMALSPVITMVLAHFFLSEKMTPRQGIGALLSMFGMMVIVARGDLAALARMEFNLGELLLVGSAIAWAAYTVLLRRMKFDIERLPLLVLLLAMGTIGAAPMFIWEIASGRHSSLDAGGLLALAYVAIPGGALMYYLYNRSVDALGASRAGMMLYLQAGFVAILAYIFLGERLRGFDLAGGAFIVAGLLVAMLPSWRARSTEVGS